MKRLLPLLFMLVGCVQIAPASPILISATGQPVASPSPIDAAPTPAATVPPTAPPVVAPATVAPTAVPVVTIPPGTAWLDYINHSAGSATKLSDVWSRFGKAKTLAQDRQSGVAFRSWGDMELRWLDSRSPQPCYQTVFDSEVTLAATVQQFGSDLVAGIDALDTGLIKQANAEESAITDQMTTQTGLLTDASGRCLTDPGVLG